MQMSKTKLILAYIAGWALAIGFFWISGDADAMGYSILFLWIIQPALILAASFLIGRNDWWGRHKWGMCAAFGIMYMLAEYLTFSLANNIAFNKINTPEFSMILYGALISLAGMGIGSAVRGKK